MEESTQFSDNEEKSDQPARPKLNSKKSKTYPIGYIQTSRGEAEISVMNDLFLNYMFDKQKNNNTLKFMVNYFLNDYIKSVSPLETNIKPIEGDIHVETQFTTMITSKQKTRVQDIKIEEKTDEDNRRITYVEFQNKVNISPPIANRAVEYFGLGIGKGKGSVANQIWFLAKNYDELLLGRDYTNYVFKEAISNDLLPNRSSIFFVNLEQLSENSKDTVVKDMANYLLGKITESEDEHVQYIISNFKKCFDSFKDEKEVVSMIDWITEERADAEARGKAEGKVELLYNMLNYTIEQIASVLNISEEQVEDIISRLEYRNRSTIQA